LTGPKLHHYVPRFYLAGFADRDQPNTIWVYENGAVQPRRQGIVNTAAETYYYTITLPSGEKEHFLESKFLAPIESAAGPVIDQLRSAPKAIVAPHHVEPLASFLTALYARSPRARKSVEQLFLGAATAITKKTMQRDPEIRRFLDANPGIPMTVEDVRQLVSEIDDPTKWELSLKKDLLVGLQFLGLSAFYPYFADKHFSLLTCSGDPEFITCDSPLSVFALDPRGRALVGAGIGLRNVEIVLPLSPRRALRLTYTAHPPRQRVSDRVVRDINRRIVYQARQYVYASRRSKRLATFVSEWFNKREEPTLDPRAMREFAARLVRARTSGRID
jgi:hypothetical protein